ncbi:FAD/NAD(P)-binding domain-containing protein [Nemania sp. NC0429]|nr:FAD/NAD(P)-binding domain-containing protein [Nemania sp. NC0429]
MIKDSKFRAIIIGGGPVGLAIANGLDRAGVDFVVVERNPTMTTDSGAGIMVWPQTTRIFDQLGIVDNCKGRFITVHDKTTTRLDGTPFRKSLIFDYLSDNHGYQCMNFPRPLLVQTLLEGLGANSAKVRTGAGIENIETTEKGVRVHLSDGSVEEGSIVIGADGVHSKTREIMQRLAEETGHGFSKEEKPIVSHYQIMYGRAKYIPGAPIATFYETHGHDMSSQISANADRMHYGIYRKLPGPAADIRHTYSEAEVAEFVQAFSDVVVMPGLTFAEVYKNSEWTRLVNQHEGLFEHWHHGGRVVLAGDSCSVMTSAAGLGVNNGIQSAVVLVNKLHELLSKDPDPDAKALSAAFDEYQGIRREESRMLCDAAAKMIRINTWDSCLSRFLGDVVLPWLIPDEKLIARFGTDVVRAMHKFDFIPGGLNVGKIPWSRT